MRTSKNADEQSANLPWQIDGLQLTLCAGASLRLYIRMYMCRCSASRAYDLCGRDTDGLVVPAPCAVPPTDPTNPGP